LIEEFMVAANGVIARLFKEAGVASIRRIVRTPKRWPRIVEVELGTALPVEPDSKALNDFLLEHFSNWCRAKAGCRVAFSLRKSHLARHSTLHVYWKNALEHLS
jgi:hypothetical protein